MGYYLRHVVTDDRPVDLAILQAALREHDAYAITAGGRPIPPDRVPTPPAEGADRATTHDEVRRVLAAARSIVAVRVLWQGREPEPTLARIDPLWGWLFRHRTGLHQADEEGWHDGEGPLAV